MIAANCTDACQVLKCAQRVFTDKDGVAHEYYQVNFIADGEFYTCSATADAASKMTFVPGNYLLTFSIGYFRNRWKLRIVDAQRVAH